MKPKLTVDDWKNNYYPALDQWEEEWANGELPNDNPKESQIEWLVEAGLLKE